MDIGSLSFDGLIGREWLATNQLGGFACSTVAGLNTRKYHGLLVAAMAPPVRRMVLLSRVEETVFRDGWPAALSSNEYPGVIHPEGFRRLRAFNYEPFPRWAYQGDGWTLEKELCLLRGRNAVLLSYSLLAAERPLTLEIRPLYALRSIHDLTYQWNGRLFSEIKSKGHHRIPPTGKTPEVFFAHDAHFDAQPNWYLNTIYRREQERGYSGLEDLWMPGVIRQTLQPGQSLHFACSTDPIDLPRVIAAADQQCVSGSPVPALSEPIILDRPQTQDALTALRRAAEQFVALVPQEGASEKSTSIVTLYPWSPPSVRGALIAFCGLLLVTGRFVEARKFLLSLVGRLRDGIMPSEFPEGGGVPVYLGSDVSLWFVNAVQNYLRYSADEPTTRRLYEAVVQIVDHYRHGTGLGIKVDADGLLGSQQPGSATTWMDARVGEWVITPREGRPVELNALWYNAVNIDADLARKFGQGDRAEELTSFARSIKEAFNHRFWNDEAGCCFDVLNDYGHDPAVRPNQLLAISLPHPVLAVERHVRVVEKLHAELLTRVGVRTLSCDDAGYHAPYAGGVLPRDRAYHNGCAFPWLLGPFVTAYLRVHGRGEVARRQALEMIQPCLDHLIGDGLGQLCELFDGDAPHAPGGALASALSIGELLRCYEEDILDVARADVAKVASTAVAGQTAKQPIARFRAPPTRAKPSQ